MASNCPKCGAPQEVRPNMFYWRGRYFSGLVCVPCNSLRDNPEDSFEEHVGLKDGKWRRDGEPAEEGSNG